MFGKLITSIILCLLPLSSFYAQNLSDHSIGIGGLYEFSSVDAAGLTFSYHNMNGLGGYFRYGNSYVIYQTEFELESTTKLGLNYTFDNVQEKDIYYSIHAGVAFDNYYEVSNKTNGVGLTFGMNSHIRGPDYPADIFIGFGFSTSHNWGIHLTGGANFKL